jgi:hypothetical protein
MRHILTTDTTPYMHQLCRSTALLSSSRHFSHASHHNKPNTPLPPPIPLVISQLRPHPHCAAHNYCQCHNYSNCPPTFRASAATYVQRACALSQTRPTCTVVVTKNASRRGKGNSLSFVCVLATLQLNTLSCRPYCWGKTGS